MAVDIMNELQIYVNILKNLVNIIIFEITYITTHTSVVRGPESPQSVRGEELVMTPGTQRRLCQA